MVMAFTFLFSLLSSLFFHKYFLSKQSIININFQTTNSNSLRLSHNPSQPQSVRIYLLLYGLPRLDRTVWLVLPLYIPSMPHTGVQ